MPSSDDQTKILIENLSANVATTSQLINSLLGDIRDNAANLMELKLKMESLSENVKSITNIVRDGNGKGSMVTRVAVLEKAIEDIAEMQHILNSVKYVTIAMCQENEPYLVTLSHGYDSEEHCIYFHCASEGKKNDILKANDVVWGQALVDEGYIQGACDHLYATVQLRGKVRFLDDFEEKKKALESMINRLEDKPEEVAEKQLNEKSITRVTIGRIDIEYMSGKKSKDVIISL